jgi:hypothetical protein
LIVGAFRAMNEGAMKTADDQTINRAKAEELLIAAKQLQTEFWDALVGLEGALGGIEIDANRDLSEATIDDLIATCKAGKLFFR